ncbi:MAG: 16S rRNA (guanine(527)-N(7))-methyltransferase RsmG [Terracidiphilus sp.]
MSEIAPSPRQRLNALLAEAGQSPLDEDQIRQFESYYSLLIRWNTRVNLTAIRDQEGILARHFVESIACARLLPAGICTLLDFGSGAGFPGIPIALCRRGIMVTLAESQGKKAAFLREAVRVLGIAAKVHSGRAEALLALFDCVTLRAVDRMEVTVHAAGRLVRPGGWLALMTTGNASDAQRAAAGAEFAWLQLLPLPGTQNRLLALGIRDSGAASQ